MPNFKYRFFTPAAGCAGGAIGANLALLNAHADAAGHSPVNVPIAHLINSQLRLGVYPAGWALNEMTWRIYSFMIGVNHPAIAALMPAAPPAIGVAAGGIGAGGGAYLQPSPVAPLIDATEKGQIGYHIGTAVGGAFSSSLNPTGPVGTQWFAFHLSRATTNGGVFTIGAQQPDIVLFSIAPGNVWHDFVVWENKGHCVNAGAQNALDPALAQAQSITHCTTLPAVAGAAAAAAPGAAGKPVDVHFASMVDLYHGDYRVQVIDPPGKGSGPVTLSDESADAFFRGYYSPFIEVLANTQDIDLFGEQSFYIVELIPGIKLGLDAKIVRAFHAKKLKVGEFASVVQGAIAEGYDRKSSDELHIDVTGLLVKVESNPSSPNGLSNDRRPSLSGGEPPLKRPNTKGSSALDDSETGDVESNSDTEDDDMQVTPPLYFGYVLNEMDMQLETRLQTAERGVICGLSGNDLYEVTVLFDKSTHRKNENVNPKPLSNSVKHWCIKTSIGNREAIDWVSFKLMIEIKSYFTARSSSQ